MRAVNPETGEVLELQGGKWVSVEPGQPQDTAGAQATNLQASSWLGKQGEAFLVGAGDVFASGIRNVKDLAAGLRGDTRRQAELEADRIEAERIRGQLREEAPVGAMLGAMAPGMIAAPLGGASVLGQGIVGAATGGLTSESGAMMQDAALGGALSAGSTLAAGMVSRANAARRMVAGQRQAAAELAGAGDEITAGGVGAATERVRQFAPDFPMTPAQRAVNPSARQWESGMANNPFFSGPIARIEAQQAQALNNLAGRTIGLERADAITPEALGSVYDRLSRAFKGTADAIGELSPQASKGLADDLAAIAEREAGSLTGGSFAPIAARAQKAVDGGEAGAKALTGAQVMNWRSQLVDRIRDMSKPGAAPDSALRASLWDAVDAIDKRIGLTLADEGAAAAYGQARQQWKMLQAVESSLTNDGNVSALKLSNALKKVDPVGFARGGGGPDQATGQLYDVTRFMASSLGAPVVSRGSPTATREVFNAAVANPSLLGAASLAGKALGSRAAMAAYERLGAPNTAAFEAYSRALAQAQASQAAQRAGGVAGGGLAPLVR